MKNSVVVGVADMQISDASKEVIVTYSLGSCLAVVLYDPYLKIGGMLHVMLPDAAIEKHKVKRNPYKFVTTGVPLLYKAMFAKGCKRKQIITKVIGGSNVLDKNAYFNIGKRNYTTIRKLLWKNNMMIKAEDVGGTKSRTVRLMLNDGTVIISNANEEYTI